MLRRRQRFMQREGEAQIGRVRRVTNHRQRDPARLARKKGTRFGRGWLRWGAGLFMRLSRASMSHLVGGAVWRANSSSRGRQVSWPPSLLGFGSVDLPIGAVFLTGRLSSTMRS